MDIDKLYEKLKIDKEKLPKEMPYYHDQLKELRKKFPKEMPYNDTKQYFKKNSNYDHGEIWYSDKFTRENPHKKNGIAKTINQS